MLTLHRDIVALGARFHGTPGAAAAVKLIGDHLSRHGVDVRLHRFECSGWAPSGATVLEVMDDGTRQIECYPMLWTPGVDGVVEGRLLPIGEQFVWGGVYAWRKFGIQDRSGRLVAYVCGRPEGPAIPQPVPDGSDLRMPHVVVGGHDLSRVEQAATRSSLVRLRVGALRTFPVSGCNVVAEIPRPSPGRVPLICAHYDTMWTTAGAYDNASGTALVIELACAWAESKNERPMTFALFGGEEWHLAGSKAYLGEMSEAVRPSWVLNLDGIGRSRLLEAWVGPEAFEWQVLEVLKRHPRINERELVCKSPPPPGSDHAPFFAAGIPVLMLTFNDQEILHRPEDDQVEPLVENMLFAAELVSDLLCDGGWQPVPE